MSPHPRSGIRLGVEREIRERRERNQSPEYWEKRLAQSNGLNKTTTFLSFAN